MTNFCWNAIFPCIHSLVDRTNCSRWMQTVREENGKEKTNWKHYRTDQHEKVIAASNLTAWGEDRSPVTDHSMVMITSEAIYSGWSSEVGNAWKWGAREIRLTPHCLAPCWLWCFTSLRVRMVTMFAHGNELPAGFSDVYDCHCWGLDWLGEQSVMCPSMWTDQCCCLQAKKGWGPLPNAKSNLDTCHL